MVIDNILEAKLSSIAECIGRIHAEYAGSAASLENITKLDSITLNLQRACEASIDLAMHIVKCKALGIPQSSREAFELLEQHGLLTADLCMRLKKMIGFRNIAVHQYQKLNPAVVRTIIERNLQDFSEFGKAARAAVSIARQG